MTLKKQIEQCDFDYINPNIVEHFTEEKIRGETKVFTFDKIISTETVIEETKKEGYVHANISELLQYAKSEWEEREPVIALGSVVEVDGKRRVPYLDRDGSRRTLGFGWFDREWSGYCYFLAVRPLSIEHSEPSTLESLTLRIEKLEALVNPKLL